ncbi:MULTISPECIES: hypothetical protein [unclassified Microcystis]|jgi:hypothetical protein|uniref:Uncharacterized protein n=1 Tax=Microcystis flos-aquae Mf_QC_C_20070823_S10D TaxID=2486236 RepID=A0A552KH44_9CHRO|nr:MULTISPECIES: hypothetical protein [unclassified Microcystis]MCA2815699.1 hypothetical protein [Microcystis sp. M085S1]MCA2856667.1 hypothetical protein [Microcystis sp. M065S1]TRT76898.1 MAG: hypothetical protein EWV64_10285 [Microcystis flos-aquae Ma_QC_C_20070823_S18]TRT99469.1 MAG: hypothetical protein EWV65_07960 [Microcystis flos-aquae Ma_QC_C_20070823_S18D]TRU60358.1 MAG: hypothetical protein EWV90_14880 [Microcystis aeruginosa Ma_QC_Ch_20071001_M135]TRV07311.1 MAG: hypothetical pro
MDKQGGYYKAVRKANRGGEVNHIPAYKSYEGIVPLNRDKGIAIWMTEADHRKTATWGSHSSAQKFRAEQRNLINKGQFEQALLMDIKDIRSQFGSKYNKGMLQALKHYKTKVRNQIWQRQRQIPSLNSSKLSEQKQKIAEQQKFQKAAMEATRASFLPNKPLPISKQKNSASQSPKKLAQLKKKALAHKTQAVQGQNNLTKSKQKAQSKSSKTIQVNSKSKLEKTKQNVQNKTQESKPKSVQYQQGLAKAKPKAQARQAKPAQHQQGLSRAKQKAQSPKLATQSRSPQPKAPQRGR